jgi:hypothetical protein
VAAAADIRVLDAEELVGWDARLRHR